MIDIERLKDARDEYNLIQEDIAIKLCITKSAYARYENENDNFPIKQLIKVCDILNISVDYIFGFVIVKNYFKNNISYDIEKVKTRLKKIRKNNNLTQAKLANILNVHRSVITNYENGKHLIATPFLYTICKKYNISADYLLGGIDNLDEFYKAKKLT